MDKGMVVEGKGMKARFEDPSMGARRGAGVPRPPVRDRTTTLNAAYTDQLRRNEELERSNAELEVLGRELAHDLSEGVATIAFFADALESTLGSSLDDSARRDLDGIRAGVERAQSLIGAALRSATGDDSADPGPEGIVDTEDVLRDALANLHAHRDQAGVTITAGALPPVAGRRADLVRLFQNLLANAFRFRARSRPLQVWIGAWRDGSRWHFEITDNGVGIDREGRAVGGVESTGDAGGHPGLGLALCRRIVAANGGRLRLEPSPRGVGTSVAFDLPAAGESGAYLQR